MSPPGLAAQLNLQLGNRNGGEVFVAAANTVWFSPDSRTTLSSHSAGLNGADALPRELFGYMHPHPRFLPLVLAAP